MPTLEETLMNLAARSGGSLTTEQVASVENAPFSFPVAPTDFSSSEAFAGANRVNEGALKRGSNTVARIGLNGETIIEGGTGFAAPPQMLKPSIGTIQEATPTIALLNQIKNLDSLSGNEKLIETIKIHGSVEETLASIRNKARLQAEMEFGIPELEQNLKTNIDADKLDPDYQNFKQDSPITARIRAIYNAAKVSAENASSRYFSENREAASLMGAIKPLLALEEKQAFQLEGKEAEKVAKQEAMESIVGVNATKLSSILTPGVKDPIASATTAFHRDPKFRDTAMKMNNPEELIPDALAGNTMATQALLTLQAERLAGGSATPKALEKATKDFKTMKQIVTSQTAYETAITALTPKGEKGVQLTKDLVESLKGMSERERQVHRMDIAVRYVKENNRQEFEGDVRTWENSSIFQDPSSPLSLLYSKARSNIGNDQIGIKNLSAGIMDYPKEERAALKQLLTNTAREALSKQGTGYYGGFADTIKMDQIINTATSESIMRALGVVPSMGIGAALGITTTRTIQGAVAGAAIGGIAGTTGEIYNRMMGIE